MTGTQKQRGSVKVKNKFVVQMVVEVDDSAGFIPATGEVAVGLKEALQDYMFDLEPDVKATKITVREK